MLRQIHFGVRLPRLGAASQAKKTFANALKLTNAEAAVENQEVDRWVENRFVHEIDLTQTRQAPVFSTAFVAHGAKYRV